ncbi:MAG: sulfatase [candidate division KSB1 bacterium]|nr:sulfatase [candidate division KSB1 bacterium]
MKHLTGLTLGVSGVLSLLGKSNAKPLKRPNILFAISDDQSWAHTGANGSRIVNTPNFDRVARQGTLFENAFCAAPQCSPSRAAILTGRNIWQLEEAGTHGSYFPRKFTVFTNLLEEDGYFIGYTGKPWAPGNWEDAGWSRNPVGPEYNEHRLEPPFSGIKDFDYAKNFKEYLSEKPQNSPFFFWFGCKEPHREYEPGSGLETGKKLKDVKLPPFFPDHDYIKSDILDYAVEIDWFDQHLGKMIDLLESRGELENTLIVVTSDNGMPFPRAKANMYEYGTRMPLAICWPGQIPAGRRIKDMVSFIDFAPTFLEIAGLTAPKEMTGSSLLNILTSHKQGLINPERDHVLTGRERHTHARPDNLGYPCRSIRTHQYLYIHNFKPERHPAGNPPPEDVQLDINTPDLKPIGSGYNDIDASPSKDFIIEHQYDPGVAHSFELACEKRPEEELYDIVNDPACIVNLADEPEFQSVKQGLRTRLDKALTKQGDPRLHGNGDIFESYPRFGRMRNFSGFKERGEYNPEYQ